MVGFVTDAEGRPVVEADVVVRWRAGDEDDNARDGESDAAGLFVVCEVPAGVDVVVEASHPDFVAARAAGHTQPGRLFVRLFRLERRPASRPDGARE